MITKENEGKLCSFYASDFHLEMIILPYINKKLEDKEEVVIITEENLKESVNILISKINLEEKRKAKLLNLNWENNYKEKIEDLYNCNSRKVCVIVNGTESFIDKIDKMLNKISDKNDINIVNCFKIEDIQNHMQDIVLKHTGILNTSGLQKI